MTPEPRPASGIVLAQLASLTDEEREALFDEETAIILSAVEMAERP